MHLMVIDYENYGILNAEYHSIVVRCFEDNDIYHVGGKVNPTSDLDFINLKLIFCDLDQTYEMQGKRIHNVKSKKTIV
ncbi:hypothetical protein Bca52824_063383 [Brassica carinata]|uniref:Uncharacterized protein n=1 Tax=Brassica carinata TaxID=52824 RepID=A0A8X7QG12_BRACI|nr:hypothetical protein Bca52824_063383 [Brassica carinata]